MHRSDRRQRLGFPSPQEWLGGLRRLLGGLGSFRHQALDRSALKLMASDSGKRSVADAKVNLELWKARAYQAQWLRQSR